MAAKSNKGNNSKNDVSPKFQGAKKSSVKSNKTVKDDDDFDLEDEETTTPKAGKKSVSAKIDDEEDNIDDIEVEANWNKGEEDEDWDPDFEEFDLPKSSKKTSVKKGSKDNEDDYKVDDEFKDLFGSNSSPKKYHEDDDY